jgi:hypothetical protein
MPPMHHSKPRAIVLLPMIRDVEFQYLNGTEFLKFVGRHIGDLAFIHANLINIDLGPTFSRLVYSKQKMD